MAHRARPRRAADVFPGFQIERKQKRQKALLDDPKMLDQTKTPMPGMGVFIRRSLLVY
jgi:hypothetical protein